MSAVFLDTVALIALAVRSDAWHDRARAIDDALTNERTPLLTTDWVLTEFLNAAARSPALRLAAAKIIRRLHGSARTTVLEATREDWVRAFDLYQDRDDKGWSLVDCASILVCQGRGVTRVFTHDHHFAQAGFEVLLR